MRRVALIYNPASGQRLNKRSGRIADVVAVLREAGVEVEAIATESPESAGVQAQEAVRQGFDTILACGGDGTVHESLQKLVGGTAALGVIPMGTANALATDLGMPSSAVKAAKALLNAVPERISVGKVFYRGKEGEECSRYFIVAAGIGPDALFLSRLDSGLKARFGYALYVVEAFRVWATHSFPMFAASFVESGSSTPRVEEVSQLLTVRISNFGGLLNNLAPGAALVNSHLRAIAFKTRSRMQYLRFLLAVVAGRHKFSDRIELVKAVSVECSSLNGSKAPLFVEADGELLGTLPVRIEVVHEALTLLIPQKAQSRNSRPRDADPVPN
jgi:YegS/Rv2252/BmrU family lipid kinase